MNKLLHKSIVSAAACAGSFVAVGGNVEAYNGYPGDGDFTVKELSDSERDMLVENGIISCSVKPEIRDALGIVTLQEEFTERGYSRSGIDGIDGKKFCQDTYKIQVDNGLYVDGIVGNQMVGFLGGLTSLIKEHGLQSANENSRGSRVKEADNSDSTCKDIRLTTWASRNIPGSDGDSILDDGEEARSVQIALNSKGYNVGNPNGDIGPRTLKGFTSLQKDKFGNADCLLGSDTYKELDLKKENTKASPKARRRSQTGSESNVVPGCEAKYNVKYVVCADTGPGTEKGYLYKRVPKAGQVLLHEFEITSSQIDTDGPFKNNDTLTRKGHYFMGHAAKKTPKLGLKNFLQFSGEQGIHYYPIVGASADSSGCIRVNWDTSVLLFNTLKDLIGKVEVIVK